MSQAIEKDTQTGRLGGESIERERKQFSKVITETSDKMIGKRRNKKNENCFDEECKNAIDRRNDARKKVLQMKSRLS